MLSPKKVQQRIAVTPWESAWRNGHSGTSHCRISWPCLKIGADALVSRLQSAVVRVFPKNPALDFGNFTFVFFQTFPTDLHELFPDPSWEQAVLRQDRLLSSQLLPYAPSCHISHLLCCPGSLLVPQPPLHDGFTVSNGQSGVTRRWGKHDVMGSLCWDQRGLLNVEPGQDSCPNTELLQQL